MTVSPAIPQPKTAFLIDKAWSFLLKSHLWIPLIFWLTLYVWRPWQLGFYYDDWGFIVECIYKGGPFSFERLAWLWNFLYQRPLLFLPHFLFSSLFGVSTFLWHTGIIIVIAICALVYYVFLRALLKMFGWESSFAAAMGTSLWLCAPWLTGVAAWPTMFTGYITVAMMAASGILWLRSWEKGESAVFWPAFLYLIQLGIYEIFAFQYVVFFGFALLAGIQKQVPWKKLAWSFLGASAAQGLLLLYKIVIPFHQGVSNWQRVLSVSITRLPQMLLKSAHEFKIYLVILLITLFVLGLVGLGMKARQLSTRPEIKTFLGRNLGYVLLCMLGIFIGLFLLSYGGRYLNSIGTFGRTTITLSFWFFAFLGLLVAWLGNLPTKLKQISFGGSIAALSLLSFATFSRTMDFAHSWGLQQEVVRNAPIEQIRQTDRNAVILFNGPIHWKTAYVYYGNYTISGAMTHFYPDLRVPPGTGNDIHGNGWKTILVHGDYDTVWDGKTVTQRSYVYPASELWYWDYENGKFSKVKPPAVFKEKDFELR
jgi:hypothetical protein